MCAPFRIRPRPTMSSDSSQKSNAGIFLIATGKAFNGMLLLAVACGAVGLLNHDVQQEAEHWISYLRVDPDNRYVAALLGKLGLVNDGDLKTLGGLAAIYAVLFLVEGVGLFLRKRWAEYLTVIATASLIPLEVYEIIRKCNVPKVALLVINVAILIYLVIRLKTERTER
jgi:uncharacterized membrane protein (DUF2068 family)